MSNEIASGDCFERLSVIGMSDKRNYGNAQYLWCQCSCGNLACVDPKSLRTGHTRSCGCLQKDNIWNRKNRRTKTNREYNAWANMKKRCYNKNFHAYHRYGGRGIQVCERWHDFDNFYADMGPCPTNGTLERIDNDGSYCPENCKWASHKEQCINRSRKGGKGYCWNKREKKWQAAIRINGKKVHLGKFNEEIDAKNAYQKALQEIRNV